MTHQTTVYTKELDKLGMHRSIIAVSEEDTSPEIKEGILYLDDHGRRLGVPIDWIDHWITFEIKTGKR